MGSVCVNRANEMLRSEILKSPSCPHKPNNPYPSSSAISPGWGSHLWDADNNGDRRISLSWAPSAFRLWLLQDMMSGSWQQAAELTWPLSQIHEQKPPRHHWHLWDTAPVKTADRVQEHTAQLRCPLCTGSARKPNPAQANQPLEKTTQQKTRKEKVHRKRNPESLRTHNKISKPAVNQSSANRQ